MRDLGSIPSPQNAFYLGVGLETLHLRMEQEAKWYTYRRRLCGSMCQRKI
ncbi:Cys/Met metabolism PLP-dependent enzyme domain protein [Shuttleworthella sp. MSX8B]|nr:Cys/Met metabolism PLP-dependent enzyme domain protein [Shuttleworthia sp. MSX8B]